MDKRKKIIISIGIILLIIILVSASTYAFITATTNDENLDTGSGMLGINYVTPNDIGGNLIPSTNRSGGLFTTTTASLKTGSQKAFFNMYIKPTALTNLNIPALKWETEALRDTDNDGDLDIVCSNSGNFSNAVVNTSIKVVNACELTEDSTIFNIYIWLDTSLINTSLSGASFGATIGADAVDITGEYDNN